jgi:hypothetical protein
MANLSKLKLVQYKRRVVAGKIAQKREELAALENQERDLEITERVLIELEEPEQDAADMLAQTARELAANMPPAPEYVPANDAVAGKPEGIPTMPEMIFEALRDAKNRGLKGLEPKDIAAYIAAKWWPGVKINNVGPIAWRLYSKDKLAKRNSKYRLPDEAEAHAAA